MAFVRLLDGTEVMTTAEYALWRDELRRHEDGDCLFNALRRDLAKRLQLRNFRRLALASGASMLGPESPWDAAECLTAVVRQYVEPATCEAEGVPNGVDLQQVAERGDTEHVMELLEKPLDPNVADTRQRTPLHMAVAMGHLTIARCLLDAAADTEKADNDGATPLHYAALRGHLDLLECLLDAGADTEKADNDGATPLHYAALRGHLDLLECLLDAGADKDKATKTGFTPLHRAAHEGRQAVVQCLLEAGADKEKADNEGLDTIAYCRRAGS
ncbi:unnamed protein product [Effrenium voratum]|nr:unnamed protein product [Effrenium voratum]